MTATRESNKSKEEGNSMLLLFPPLPGPDCLGIGYVFGGLVLVFLNSLLPQTSSRQPSPLPEPLISSPVRGKAQVSVDILMRLQQNHKNMQQLINNI